MTPTPPHNLAPRPRRDGWTPARRQAFLDLLRSGLDVRRAAAQVGLSRCSVYKLRARDEGFAAAWDAALREARAEEQSRFAALLMERCPWALSVDLGGTGEGVGSLSRTPSTASGLCKLRRAEARLAPPL